jgi:hypothetical protein
MAGGFKVIIIFLGPSLPLDEAQKILPEARFLPPVQSGDILRTLRLNPKTIGIIDGYFENVSAVWHKEILYALSKGVQVMGCSSMGALRASELAAYGMIPVGKIAQDYLSGIVNDDDEVALLHGTNPSGYVGVTEALFNIRATLESACQNNIITRNTFDCILTLAKNLHYRERLWQKILHLSYKEDIDKAQITRLEQWLANPDNKLDVKRNDAIVLLKTIADDLFLEPNKKPFILNRSVFFRALQKNTGCRPFSSYHSWLPIQEKVALSARYLDQPYILLRRLAYLLAACYSLALQRKIESDGVDASIFMNGSDFECNDCTPEEKEKFLKRMRIISALLKQEQQATDLPGTAQDYLLLLMRLSQDYTNLKRKYPDSNNESLLLNQFRQAEPKKHQLMLCMAHCWWFIERCALRLGLQPDFDILEDYANQFRLSNHLETTEKIQQWLSDNDLDLDGYQYLMSANVRLKFLVFENNLDVLNCSLEDNDSFWLLDALRLSGFYEEAKNVLTDPKKLTELKQRIKSKVSNLEEYALFLDFVGGEQDFMGGIFNGSVTTAAV